MSRKSNLLLVEEDLAVREAITKVLESEDYQVSSATSSEEAMLRFAENQIDLVLLDLSLGNEEGWSVFHALRKIRPHLPIIVTSARVDALAHSSASKANAILEKPFDVGMLLSLLRETGNFKALKQKDPEQ